MKENLPLRVLQPEITGKETASHYETSIAFVEMLSKNRMYLESNGEQFVINKRNEKGEIIEKEILTSDNYKDGLSKLNFVAKQQFYKEYM